MHSKLTPGWGRGGEGSARRFYGRSDGFPGQAATLRYGSLDGGYPWLKSDARVACCRRLARHISASPRQWRSGNAVHGRRRQAIFTRVRPS